MVVLSNMFYHAFLIILLNLATGKRAIAKRQYLFEKRSFQVKGRFYVYKITTKVRTYQKVVCLRQIQLCMFSYSLQLII